MTEVELKEMFLAKRFGMSLMNYPEKIQDNSEVDRLVDNPGIFQVQMKTGNCPFAEKHGVDICNRPYHP